MAIAAPWIISIEGDAWVTALRLSVALGAATELLTVGTILASIRTDSIPVERRSRVPFYVRLLSGFALCGCSFLWAVLSQTMTLFERVQLTVCTLVVMASLAEFITRRVQRRLDVARAAWIAVAALAIVVTLPTLALCTIAAMMSGGNLR